MFGIENNIYIPQGTLEERVRYTNKLNETFKSECSKNNMFFFENIFKDELVSENGELLDIYCDSLTHYNQNAIKILEKETTQNFTNILNRI
jgi:hypothetical protein